MTRDGMVPAEEWAKTDVHKASTYSCGKCCERFDSPEAVYNHLDAEHPQPKRRKTRKKATHEHH